MTLSFAPLAPSSLPIILPMMRTYYAFDHLAYDEDVARAALEELMDHPEYGRVFIMRSGEEMVGYMILGFGYSAEFGGRIAFVDELFVKAEERGKGIGTAALAFADEVCQPLGIKALRLEVTNENLRARALYQKIGFAVEKRTLMTKRIQKQ